MALKDAQASENFIAKSEISLSPIKSVTKPLMPYASSKNVFGRMSSGTLLDFGRKPNYNKPEESKLNLTMISLNDGSKTTRKTHFKLATTKSPDTPQRNTVLKSNGNKKRRRIKNPLGHAPYMERDSEESIDINDSGNNSDFEEVLKNEKEEANEEKPQSGVESGAQQVDYDNLNFVYQNQEESSGGNEKPAQAVKKPMKPKLNLSEQKVSEFTFSTTPTNQKKKRNFSLEDVKEYIDALEDYEVKKKKNEIDNGKIVLDEKACGGKCVVF